MLKRLLSLVVLLAIATVAVYGYTYTQRDMTLLEHPTSQGTYLDLKTITEEDLALIKSRFDVMVQSLVEDEPSTCNWKQNLCALFLAGGCGGSPNENTCQCGGYMTCGCKPSPPCS